MKLYSFVDYVLKYCIIIFCKWLIVVLNPPHSFGLWLTNALFAQTN